MDADAGRNVVTAASGFPHVLLLVGGEQRRDVRDPSTRNVNVFRFFFDTHETEPLRDGCDARRAAAAEGVEDQAAPRRDEFAEPTHEIGGLHGWVMVRGASPLDSSPLALLNRPDLRLRVQAVAVLIRLRARLHPP